MDDLPELSDECKKLVEETKLCWEFAVPEGITQELWRVVSNRPTVLGRSLRFSEWYASRDRVDAALARIESECWELVSVTKCRSEPSDNETRHSRTS